MVQIDIQMPSDCYSCWVRKNMGCKIANDSGWLNNKRDDNCPLKEQEPVPVKLDGEYTNIKYGHCPNCGEGLNSEVYPHWCGFCGQAVKWE